jgi:hypothetical protein
MNPLVACTLIFNCENYPMPTEKDMDFLIVLGAFVIIAVIVMGFAAHWLDKRNKK